MNILKGQINFILHTINYKYESTKNEINITLE